MKFKALLLSLVFGISMYRLAGGEGADQKLSRARLADLKAVMPVMSCADLASAGSKIQADGVVHITKTSEMTDNGAAYCRVQGYVDPAVRFEVLLPLKTWTQRYVQTGCGGLCGTLNIHLSNDETCAPAQNGELALASTDMGHDGGMDAAWADGHPERAIDFAYRGVHVTALAAKALIEAFYAQQPKYSYFAGCSDGGREALMEAERFPEDFDGITAGAPAMNFITQNTFYHGWNAVQNHDDDGRPILTAEQLPILHAAVIQACDGLDGLKDGLISDPTDCHFDPVTIQCRPGDEGGKCLSEAQVHVAKEIYRGAHDMEGQRLVISGPQYGSELAWEGVYVPRTAGARTMSGAISVGTFRFLTSWQPHPDRTLADLKFTAAEFREITVMHNLFDATDPDLSKFAALNHKLILWHGWQDPHISPLNTIAYYEAMTKALGETRVKQFARLYLFPGGYHCGGGEGPFNMDLLNPIMQWVEAGSAPGKIVAAHNMSGHGPGGPPPDGIPPAEVKVDRTRPVFPYPEQAKYKGDGSVDLAASFIEVPGKVLPAERLEWLGSSFYRAGYEKWCSVGAEGVKCSSKRDLK